jgi:hypothetical protein
MKLLWYVREDKTIILTVSTQFTEYSDIVLLIHVLF